MAAPQHRFEDRNERVALRIPVELGQGDFEDPFQASTVNLSKGGLQMRSACLPDPGTRLSCRFRAQPSNVQVTAQGEVVWAHLDGEESGEFGLSFVDLDPKTEWLIEEMLAEQARLEGPRPDGEVAATVAQLELEGSSGAISTRVAKKDGRTVVFAHSEGKQGRQGSIRGVELRMVGSVPMLAVTVSFDEGGSSVGFVPAELAMPSVLTPAAAEEPAPEHDTAPDLNAPGRATLIEFEARPSWVPPSQRREPSVEVEHAAFVAQEWDDSADEASVEEMASALVHELPTANPSLEAADAALFASPLTVPAASIVAAEASQRAAETAEARIVMPEAAMPKPRPARLSSPLAAPEPVLSPAAKRESSVTFRTAERSEADDEAELAAMFEPEPSSLQRVATRVLLALRVHGGALLRALGPLAQQALDKSAPVLRTLWLRSAALLRALIVDRVAPQLGAGRRMLAGVFSQRRRRKTTAPAHAMAVEERSGLGRTLLLSLMGAGALAMAVYAFAPSGSEDGLALTGAVKRMPGGGEGKGAPEPIAAAATPAVAEPSAVPDPRVVPSASSVPAGSPFAVDVRGKAGAAKATASSLGSSIVTTSATTSVGPSGKGKLRFGAAQVSNGKRFNLRMSAPIKALEGAADVAGFTVVAHGGLALDRAGPISSALPAVKRSMIINKGDRAELTIRFNDGKNPAYQVTADGNTLSVLIQDI